MDTIRVLLAVDLRHRVRAWSAVVLLIALVGGASMAGLAAWQRTSTAMDRFVDDYRPANLHVAGELRRADVEAVPGVEEVASGEYFLMVPVVDGEARPEALGGVSPFGIDNGDVFRTFERSMVVEGRLADPDEELEVVVDEELSETYGVAPGDRFPMRGYAFEQAEQLFAQVGGLVPEGPAFDLLVTGVVRAPQDVVPKQRVPDVIYLGSSEVFLGPAFTEAHAGNDVLGLEAMFGDPSFSDLEVRADLGSTPRSEIEAAIQELDPDAAVEFGQSDAERAAEEGRRAIDMQAGLVLAFASLVALGGALLVVQALRRLFEDDAARRLALISVGISPSTLMRFAAVRAAIVGSAGAVLAGVVAVALSPLGPIGFGRRAEVHGGVEIRPFILIAGFTAIVALVVVVSSLLAARQARGMRLGTSRPGLGNLAVRLGLPAPVVAGVRAAALTPGASVVAAVVLVACTGVVGGVTFAGSQAKLAHEPALWGWSWDFVVGDGNDSSIGDRGQALIDDRDVASVTTVHALEAVAMSAGGRSVDSRGSALQVDKGDIAPRLLEGTLPDSDEEVALGAATASALGVGVGDEVLVQLAGEPTPFTVSGTTVMNQGLDSERIGEGSLFTVDGATRAGGEPEPTSLLISMADGVDLDDAYRDIRADWGNTVLRPLAPVDVYHLDSVRHLPTAFSALVALVAAVTLGFVLTLTVRRGRRDLAVLRSLGFDTRQIRAAVAVQATTLVAPAAVIGTFGGVVGGRVAWRLVAEGMGAPAVPVVSAATVLLVLGGSLAVGNLIAAFPARMAAATHPAVALRAE